MRPEDVCPQCGRLHTRTVNRSLGMHWKVICRSCGHVFSQGVGIPPADDLEV